jgi:hypothetical protein
MIPKIHSNGTDRRTLIDERVTVLHALDAVMKAMAEGCPNCRDYYHTNNYKDARTEYENRLKIIQELWDEIEEEARILDGESMEESNGK